MKQNGTKAPPCAQPLVPWDSKALTTIPLRFIYRMFSIQIWFTLCTVADTAYRLIHLLLDAVATLIM